jgi:hypothetical protein
MRPLIASEASLSELHHRSIKQVTSPGIFVRLNTQNIFFLTLAKSSKRLNYRSKMESISIVYIGEKSGSLWELTERMTSNLAVSRRQSA